MLLCLFIPIYMLLVALVDNDECESLRLNNCDQVCQNTVGSYLCQCSDGFIMFDGNCEGTVVNRLRILQRRLYFEKNLCNKMFYKTLLFQDDRSIRSVIHAHL